MSDAPTPAPPASAQLAEHAAEWLGVVSRRCSRRTFDRTQADPAELDALTELCDTWRPYPDARVALAPHPSTDVFTGLIGSYGKITGAPHLLVFIGDERADFTDQHVGYTGEAIVLEATARGLATCWVGGFFSAPRVAEVVELSPGERAYAVSPLGYVSADHSATERTLSAIARSSHRKSVAEIARGAETGGWPEWAIAAVETVRVAPSASNRQPWRLRFEHGGLVIAKNSSMETPMVAKRLDIGIAMLHAELAAEAHGVHGHWTDLAGSDVARFDPTDTEAAD